MIGGSRHSKKSVFQLNWVPRMYWGEGCGCGRTSQPGLAGLLVEAVVAYMQA